jgi:hypothetical protein
MSSTMARAIATGVAACQKQLPDGPDSVAPYGPAMPFRQVRPAPIY